MVALPSCAATTDRVPQLEGPPSLEGGPSRVLGLSLRLWQGRCVTLPQPIREDDDPRDRLHRELRRVADRLRSLGLGPSARARKKEIGALLGPRG